MNVRVALYVCIVVFVFATSGVVPTLEDRPAATPFGPLNSCLVNPIARVTQLVGGDLVIAMDSDIQTMDPAKTSAMYGPPGMIYETLITRDKTGAYAPGLAENWHLQNTSGTGYPYKATFNITLKQGVKFHDGSSFNSDAAKRIINYLSQNDSWVQYQFWSIFGCQNKTGWPDSGIWCRDDHNMTLNLTWTDVALEFNLSNLYSSMMSPDALESDGLALYGTPGHKVVGTGPYILYEWVDGDHVTLVKNPNYTWGASWYSNKGPAKIDRVIFRMIYDQAARFAAFESGAVDVLQQVPPNKMTTYQSNPSLTVMTGPGQGVYYLEFNCQKDPWTNVSLRKAFAYSINRTTILQIVWHGIGEEGVNYLPPIEPESTSVPASYNFTFDVVKAKEHFEVAGYTDTDSDNWLENGVGGELTLQLWTTNRGDDVAMSEILHMQFEEIGVHVALTQYPETELRSRAAASEQEAILFWYSWPRAEILDWHFGTWAVGGSNTAWYIDPVFDEYVVNWTYAETQEEFSDNATAAHIRLLTQAPWAPIIFWHQIDALHNYVKGWYVQPFGMEQVFDIVDVELGLPPTAVALVTPNPAMAGEGVMFNGSGSSDDFCVVNWTWTFADNGDFVELWGETAVHTFLDDFQMVVVTLTVRDGDGNVDTDTVFLDVVGWIPEYPIHLVPAIGTVLFVLLFSLAGRRRREVTSPRKGL